MRKTNSKKKTSFLDTLLSPKIQIYFLVILLIILSVIIYLIISKDQSGTSGNHNTETKLLTPSSKFNNR